ncbi:hypothetical protein BH23ACT10_BH23ACT10_05750 [soil metagenome]
MTQTPTTSSSSRDSGRTRAPEPRRGRLRLIALAVTGVLLGTGAGLLLLRERTPQPSSATQAQAATTDLGDELAALQAKVDRSPDDIGAWQSLAVVAVRRAAQLGDPAYYEIARRAVDRADEVVADDPQTLVARGELALALHDFDDALRYGERAQREMRDNVVVLGVVVDAQVELGRYDDAAETLQRMLDVRPSVSALSRASYLRELTGDLEGARTAMRQAETAASGATAGRATVTALRGDLAFQAGDLQLAAEHYASALEASPDLVAAAVGAARVQAAGGDLDAAEEALSAVVERLPTPDAVTLLADVQRLQGDDAAAEANDELARTLSRLQAEQGQAVDLELALFEADRGDDPARAVTLARRASEERPDNVYAADALAWALARDGDVAEARRLLRDALRLGSVDPLVRFHAAWILARDGDTDAAREHLTFVAERNPWFSFALLDEAGELADELDVPRPPAWDRG